MKRHIRRFTEVVIILVALGAGLFSQRVVIAQWFADRSQPELPPAIGFEQTQTQPPILPEPVPAPVNAQEGSIAVKEPPVLPVDQGEKEQPALEVPPDLSAPVPQSDLPASINLAVPFTSQAPYADWSAPYKETCEEASFYMVDQYYQKTAPGLIPAETANKALLGLVDFEMELFGAYEDSTITQMATLAEMFAGYEHVDVMTNPTLEEMKQQVASGRPIIVPTAGRLLGNPYFQNPGPIYHMLVVRGYTQEGMFITNDPGTRHGEAFLYPYETLMNAMHDWNGGENIEAGAKRILVIYPN